MFSGMKRIYNDALAGRVISCAPMAGGPSTPELARTISEHGGLGFLAGGTIPVEKLRQDLQHMKGCVYALNLFCPQRSRPKDGDIKAFYAEVARLYASENLPVPDLPDPDFSNGWEEKMQAIIEATEQGYGPAVLSCTFGVFSEEDIQRLRRYRIQAWVTVTNEQDAAIAAERGADALVVQGPEAGGHRSTWCIEQDPDERSLDALLKAVHERVPSMPLIAAGGIATRARVKELLELPGVVGCSIGTAFLRAHEAGTSESNRQILGSVVANPNATVASRAFSGRVARGVRTPFSSAFSVRSQSGGLPPLYPYVNALLGPLRNYFAERGRPDVAYCLAGVHAGQTQALPAAEILRALKP